MRGDDAIRRFSAFNPRLQRCDFVELSRSVSAIAMIHPRNHEETHGVVSRPFSDSCSHTVVIVNCGLRSKSRVVPAVIQQQLSAMTEETRQIRIGGVDGVVIDFIRPRQVPFSVKRPIVPCWVLESQIPELLDAWNSYIGSECPAEFASWCQTRVELPSGAGFQSTINSRRRLCLRCGEAIRIACSLTEELIRVKRAFPWIVENSVSYTVCRVTSGEDRIVKQLILAGRDVMCRTRTCRVVDRDRRRLQVRGQGAGRSGQDAIVIQRKLLCLLETLSTAGGTSIPV